jgi:hypothetical protein
MAKCLRDARAAIAALSQPKGDDLAAIKHAQERGDAWRDLFNADTTLIAALRVQLQDCREAISAWRANALTIKSKMGDESDHEYGADSASVHFLNECADEIESVIGK